MKFITEEEKKALQERFTVHDGQMRFPHTFKNLHLRFNDNFVTEKWDTFVDVRSFNYGDVNEGDLLRFMEELKPGEMIVGLWESWNYDPKGTDHEKIPSFEKDVAFTVTCEAIRSKNRPSVNITK
jgi:hypothetical protein